MSLPSPSPATDAVPPCARRSHLAILHRSAGRLANLGPVAADAKHPRRARRYRFPAATAATNGQAGVGIKIEEER